MVAGAQVAAFQVAEVADLKGMASAGAASLAVAGALSAAAPVSADGAFQLNDVANSSGIIIIGVVLSANPNGLTVHRTPDHGADAAIYDPNQQFEHAFNTQPVGVPYLGACQGPAAGGALSASGDGTAGKPYVICSLAQLSGVGAKLSAYYVLGSDIDASSTSSLNQGQGFTPLGSFSGTFDGQGYTITGLTINTAGKGSVGLFADLGSGATVKNLRLDGVAMTGQGVVGAVAASMEGATVQHVVVSGSVSCQNWCGGIVGSATANSRLSQLAFLSGKVTASNAFVGGVVGQSISSQVTESLSLGDVSGAANCGGLAGDLESASQVSDSFAAGSITCANRGGGLVGVTGQVTVTGAAAAISRAYSRANVSGGTALGGLIGELAATTAADAFAGGTVAGTTIGGILGQDAGVPGSKIQGVAWLREPGTAATACGPSTAVVSCDAIASGGWDADLSTLASDAEAAPSQDPGPWAYSTDPSGVWVLGADHAPVLAWAQAILP